MGPSPTSTAAITDFVNRLRAEPRAAFLALRALVVNLGPDVVERVTQTAVLYLRRDRQFLKVESTRATRLTATIPPGIDMEDAMGRLLTRGQEKYFKLEKSEDLDGHTQEFVRKAYAAAR